MKIEEDGANMDGEKGEMGNRVRTRSRIQMKVLRIPKEREDIAGKCSRCLEMKHACNCNPSRTPILCGTNLNLL